MNFKDLENLMRESVVPNFPELRLIYLFGSQVTGKTGPLSDYDLALLVDRDRDTTARRAFLEHILSSGFDTRRLDLVWLSQSPLELAFAVISQGRLIYERDAAIRVEFEAQVMSRYFDYLPILRAQRAEILAGGDSGVRIQRYREALGRTERTLREIRAAQREKPGRI